MKPDIFYHYLFYKLFKLLQERTSPAFTWTATILTMVALQLWAMISLIEALGYVFGKELLTDNNIWTFVGMFAIMLLGLNILIFNGGNRLLTYTQMFEKWEANEHNRYMNVLQVAGYTLVLHAVVWAS